MILKRGGGELGQGGGALKREGWNPLTSYVSGKMKNEH